jgi:hypothetical protein
MRREDLKNEIQRIILESEEPISIYDILEKLKSLYGEFTIEDEEDEISLQDWAA